MKQSHQLFIAKTCFFFACSFLHHLLLLLVGLSIAFGGKRHIIINLCLSTNYTRSNLFAWFTKNYHKFISFIAFIILIIFIKFAIK